MIVPFGAGGPGDIFARLIGQKLSEQLGQQFVIENRPGAGGNIGAGVAARAPADGYTLLVGSSTLWVNASLYPQIPYDPVRDFEPIIIGATSPGVAQEGTSAMSHNAILAVISLLAEKWPACFSIIETAVEARHPRRRARRPRWCHLGE